MRQPQAALLCDSDASPRACALARRVGEMLAELGVALITGGGGGAMKAACRAAVGRGGITVGILPSANAADANDACRIVIPTGLGHARNALVTQSADVVIAMGASAGTLSELCFAWMHGKPILLMKGFCGKWEKALARGIDSRGSSRVIQVASLEALRTQVRRVIRGRSRARGKGGGSKHGARS